MEVARKGGNVVHAHWFAWISRSRVEKRTRQSYAYLYYLTSSYDWTSGKTEIN